jgi:hypothetical protein
MSRARSDLHIHEQLLLLALRDEKGTLESRAGMYQYALGGAILSELLVEGCIAVGEDKKKLVDVVKIKRMYEPVLDECLGMIASAKRRRSASNWVSRFGQIRKLRHRVASGLCHRGILKDSEDKVLLFFTRRIYPTIDPGPERRLVGSLRKAIFSEPGAAIGRESPQSHLQRVQDPQPANRDPGGPGSWNGPALHSFRQEGTEAPEAPPRGDNPGRSDRRGDPAGRSGGPGRGHGRDHGGDDRLHDRLPMNRPATGLLLLS